MISEDGRHYILGHNANMSHNHSEGDEELLCEKWLSVLFHIQNKHKWRTGKGFIKCSHRRLTKRQVKAKLLDVEFEPFQALQNMVTDENTLKDLKYRIKF